MEQTDGLGPRDEQRGECERCDEWGSVIGSVPLLGGIPPQALSKKSNQVRAV